MSLGQRIKKIRGNITQTELSKLMKVDRSTIASWEINRREPDLESLSLLADLFNVSIDWLAGRTPHCTKDASKEWEDVIAFALSNKVAPENLKSLIVSALNIKS